MREHTWGLRAAWETRTKRAFLCMASGQSSSHERKGRSAVPPSEPAHLALAPLLRPLRRRVRSPWHFWHLGLGSFRSFRIFSGASGVPPREKVKGVAQRTSSFQAVRQSSSERPPRSLGAGADTRIVPLPCNATTESTLHCVTVPSGHQEASRAKKGVKSSGPPLQKGI